MSERYINYAFSWFQDCHHQKGGDCGSNAFQGYFDDAKESRVKKNSKIQESSFQVSRFKTQESRFKNNQDQYSRLKIQESREDLIKISTKNVFQNIE